MSEIKKDNKTKKVKRAEQTLRSCILGAISSGVVNIRRVVSWDENTRWKKGYSSDSAWTLLLAQIRRQQKTMGSQRVNELMLSMDAAITAAEQKVVEKVCLGADAAETKEGKREKKSETEEIGAMRQEMKIMNEKIEKLLSMFAQHISPGAVAAPTISSSSSSSSTMVKSQDKVSDVVVSGFTESKTTHEKEREEEGEEKEEETTSLPSKKKRKFEESNEQGGEECKDEISKFSIKQGETDISLSSDKGESMQHMRGKECLIDHLHEWSFKIVCPCCKRFETYEFRDTNFSAEREYRFHAPDGNLFIFDVVIKDNKETEGHGKIAFILEVKYSHTCTAKKQKYLNASFKDKWLEIDAERLIDCDERKEFELRLMSKQKCEKCAGAGLDGGDKQT